MVKGVIKEIWMSGGYLFQKIGYLKTILLMVAIVYVSFAITSYITIFLELHDYTFFTTFIFGMFLSYIFIWRTYKFVEKEEERFVNKNVK